MAEGKPRKNRREEMGKEAYEKHKERVSARQKQAVESAQCVSGYCEPVNPDVKAACRTDLARFAQFYCENSSGKLFGLPFSPDHRKVIAKIETSIIDSGMYALAMPRANGKSTLCAAACCWALLYGWRKFVLLVGATAEHSLEMLDNVKAILEESDAIYDDFREIAGPIRDLGGEARKQMGQRYDDGSRTEIHWGGDYVDLVKPRPGVQSPAYGGMLRCTGITGRLRGYNVNGLRPDLAIFDDPQTDESADSDSQNAKRERILARSVIGLAGPGKSIAAIMPCTVLRPGDMADRILSHELHPEWDSSRTKLLYKFPDNMELWERYKEMRIGYNPDIEGDKQRAQQEASCFYIEHQAAMDVGADVAWPERFNVDEISAVQYAMNLFFQDKHAFFSEYQNDPLPEDKRNPDDLTAAQVAAKTNNLPRGRVPIDASKATAFIDVQGKILYYVVCAWCEDFTGYIIDYGTWPDQKRPYFVLGDVQRTFATALPKIVGQEALLYAALDALTTDLLGKEWPREGGTGLRISQCNVDAGYETDTIYRFCRQSHYAASLTPSHGKGIGASSQPITARQQKPGERFGLNWIMPLSNKRAKQYVLADVNFWKSFIHARLAVPMGGPGCLSIFGDSPGLHRMFADHITSEVRNPVESERTKRKVDEWTAAPGVENHWLDALVGCAVAASMHGVSLEKVHAPSKPKAAKKRMTLEEMKAAARMAGAR